MSSSSIRVSVAVPLLNEELLVDELLRRLGAVLDEMPGGPHEMLFVDDGSTDGTLAALGQAADKDSRIGIVSLSRNFGHQAAISAALDHARGDVVVAMDGDLQDEPEMIPRFLEQYHRGFDVVYARRTRRKESWWLRASYFLFYRLLAGISNVRLPVDAGDFALMSRRVVDEIRRAPERQRYLRGLRTWAGFKQVGIDVERAERAKGRSKYGIGKLFRLAFDGIFAFSVVPLRAAAMVGAVAVLLSTLFAVYSLWAKFFLDRSPQGFTAIILVVTFVSGVNLFFLGVIGEYVGRVYEEVKGRPLYVVDQVRRSGMPDREGP
ncbi:MAG: glycosyltransferase family 2 protein [Gemmatimonadetes bacterium]|nr:glycosyltransferase family 2 protein [Gemmatimonadota bacterium]